MASSVNNTEDSSLPQWKKDLIQRRRNQSKCLPAGRQGTVQLSRPAALAQTAGSVMRSASPVENRTQSPSHGGVLTGAATLCTSAVHQPSLTSTIAVETSVAFGTAAGRHTEPLLLHQQTSSQQVSRVVSSNNSAINTLPSTTTPHLVQCDTTINQRQQIKTVTNSSVKMVQDNSELRVRSKNHNKMTVMNGDYCNKNETAEKGNESDSSEELQYGPGIVNKLKSKYLSLTLRQATIKSRPSILRRATSLENMLDDSSDLDDNLNHEDCVDKGERKFISRSSMVSNSRIVQSRYRNTTRGNDSMKRARSVETLVRYNNIHNDHKYIERNTNSVYNSLSKESLNEDVVIIDKEGNDKPNRKPMNDNISGNNIVQSSVVDIKKQSAIVPGGKINRPKRITPLMDETERPPADLVKTTMRIFETSANRKPRSVKPVGDVAVKVDKFKTIIDNDKKSSKPNLKPKPVLNEKSRAKVNATSQSVKPPGSPKKLTQVPSFEKIYDSSSSDRSLSPVKRSTSPRVYTPPLNSVHEAVKCSIETPKPEDELTTRPDVSRIAELFEKSSSTDDTGRASLTETPDLIPRDTPPLLFCPIPPIRSPPPVKTLTNNFIQNECKTNERNVQTPSPTNSISQELLSPVELKSPSEFKTLSNELLSPTSPKKISPSISPVQEQPPTIRNGINEKITAPPVPPRTIIENKKSTSLLSTSPIAEPSHPQPQPIASPRLASPDTDDENDGEQSKTVSKNAIQNINNAGLTMHFVFDKSSKTKSHLPTVNNTVTPEQQHKPTKPAIPVTTTSNNLESNKTTTETKKDVVLEPLRIITQIQKQPSKSKPNEPVVRNNDSTSLKRNDEDNSKRGELIIKAPVVPPTINNKSQQQLTDREIEKNFINNVKTLEKPVSKVAVSVKSVDEVTNKCDSQGSNSVVLRSTTSKSGASSSGAGGGSRDKKSAWNPNQNSVFFNFSDRDTVPDYIENDGMIKKVKREKPKPGEGGIILLPDAPQDESYTDGDDDWSLYLGGPPSPCDVEFLNDNILIDGRSSMCKQSKRTKLKIHFDDSATETFEYPSESSLLDESITTVSPTSIPTTSSSNNPAAPSPIGSTLSNYTPSKIMLNSEVFQLGVTRTAQPPPLPPRMLNTGPPSYEQPDYLKPATEVDTITWGSETLSDLLF